MVVPIIDQKDRWFYICTGGPSVMGAVSDPKSFFGADNVINVATATDNLLNENEEINLVGEIGDRNFQSGSRMSLSDLSPYWMYIPYNFDEDKGRNQLITELKNNDYFVKAAEEMSCSIDDLLHNDKFINGNFAIINSIYKEICTDGANRCSLVVYSGPIKNKDIPPNSVTARITIIGVDTD